MSPRSSNVVTPHPQDRSGLLGSARMHWAVARTVIEELAPREVVDPFCVGGTEARVAGARSLGMDLSPLSGGSRR